MPRAKYAESPYNFAFSEIGHFKENYSDFLVDFKIIYEDLLEYYGNKCPKYQEICSKLNALKSIKISCSSQNRIYILTNFDEPVLAIVNLDEYAVNDLINTYDLVDSLIYGDCDDCHSSYNSRLYVFKSNRLYTKTNISTFRLAEFMAVFKSENIVNYQGARDDYYGKPRRKKTELNVPD